MQTVYPRAEELRKLRIKSVNQMDRGSAEAMEKNLCRDILKDLDSSFFGYLGLRQSRIKHNANIVWRKDFSYSSSFLRKNKRTADEALALYEEHLRVSFKKILEAECALMPTMLEREAAYLVPRIGPAFNDAIYRLITETDEQSSVYLPDVKMAKAVASFTRDKRFGDLSNLALFLSLGRRATVGLFGSGEQYQYVGVSELDPYIVWHDKPRVIVYEHDSEMMCVNVSFRIWVESTGRGRLTLLLPPLTVRDKTRGYICAPGKQPVASRFTPHKMF